MQPVIRKKIHETPVEKYRRFKHLHLTLLDETSFYTPSSAAPAVSSLGQGGSLTIMFLSKHASNLKIAPLLYFDAR